jgi:hypothetical protein
MKRAAASVLFAASVLLAGLMAASLPTTPSPTPPTLTYLGCFTLPKEVPLNAVGGFTQRRHADGTKTGLCIGHISDCPIFEFSLPGFGMPGTTAGHELDVVPKATLVRAYGNLFPTTGTGAVRTWPKPLTNGGLPIRGLYCTQDGARLIACYSFSYNVNDAIGYPFACMATDLDAAAPTVVGPYTFTNAPNNRVSGYALELAGFGPNYTLAWGAGIVSGAASCSHGPDLWIAGMPGPRPLGLGRALPLLDFGAPHFCARTDDYVPVARTPPVTGPWLPTTASLQFPPALNGQGRWGTADSVEGAAAVGSNWVSFCGYQSHGYEWYGEGTITLEDGSVITSCAPAGKGQNGQYQRPVLWWVHTSDLHAVKAGTLASWQPAVTCQDLSAFDLILNCQRELCGMSFDAATSTLLVGAPRANGGTPIVHGFHVTGQ